MFDLFRSRDKMVRYLLGAVLLVVAASMVTYLIPGYGSTPTTGTDDSVLAEVGDQKVMAQQVKRQLEQLISGGQLPAQMADVYLPQIVTSELRERAVVYEFNRQGLVVSDDQVLVGLMSAFPQFFQNGQLVSQAALEDALAQQGSSLNQLIDDMRGQIMLRNVQNLALTGVIVTPQQVDQALIFKHEKATIEYILFPPAKFRDQVKPTAEDLRQYFSANRNAFITQAKRSFQVVVLDQAKVEASLVIPESQLRAAYSASMDNFRMPERVKARHILISTQGKSDSEKKQLLTKAQDVLKQLKGGADFAQLAQKTSDDPGSKASGGDLGWLVRGQTVAEFEKTAFSLKPKELSDVVTTQFGYHIIQVTEKEAARVKPFDEVKAGLAEDLKKQGVSDKMQSASEQIRAALVKSPGSAAEIAKQNGAEAITVTKSQVGDAIPGLGVAPEVDGALAAMKKNDVSAVLTLPANRLAVVVLNEDFPAKPAEFDEVESAVRERYMAEKTQTLAVLAAKQAADRLRAGEDMEKVAKSMKLELAKPAAFGHSDSIEGLGQSTTVQEAFTKPIGTILGPITAQGSNLVCKIVGRDTPDPKQYPEERAAAMQTLKQQAATDRNSLFLDSILNQLIAEGKVKRNEDAIKRLAASVKQ